MIYRVNKVNHTTNLNECSNDNEEYLSLSLSEYNDIEDKLDNILCDNEKNIAISRMEEMNETFSLYIPKAHARGEKNSKETCSGYEDVVNIPHYEIIVDKQIGTWRNRRDTNLYFKLPKSGKLIRIILHMNQGVSFDKQFHTMLIRETDALDRLIVLGFCMKYQSSLKDACYAEHDSKSLRTSLKLYALYYNKDMMPKRLKQGDQGVDSSRFWTDMKPYEENAIKDNIFTRSKIAFMNY